MLIVGTFILQWFFRIVVFSFLEIKACISHILISNQRFIALYKNLLGVLRCEHMIRLCGFAKLGILVKVA